MSRHRARPDRRLRYWNTLATATAALIVAAVIGGADTLGDHWTPAAHTTPTISRPVADDPGQFGRRGLPVPARIFPTDLNAPDYAIGDGDAAAEVPTAGLSAPVRACRCLPRLPVPTETVPEAPAPPQTESAPEQTVTEAAETTAAPTTDPTATEPVPEETSPVTEEPTVPVELPVVVEEVGGDE